MLQKMVRLLTANYIEHTDVSIKIMAVLIGKDNTIQIKKDVLAEIFQEIKQYNYETGGIIGVNKKGVISAFKFDENLSSNQFEYCPNVDFLNQVINEKWAKQNIKFVGFVHSHLHNDTLSMQDVIYARDILKENCCLENIIIGIINLGESDNQMEVCLVDAKEELKIYYTVI